MKTWFSVFFSGAALAVGLVCSSYIISKSFLKVWQNDQIRVKGTASRLVKSDSGTWSGSFNVKNATLENGYKELAFAKRSVHAYLLQLGLKEEEIEYSEINVNETAKRDAKGNNTNEVDYFTLSITVRASSKNVELIDKVSREFTSLISIKIYAVSYGASFTISDLDSYKTELLAEATQNATERAEVLAGNSKGKVGNLISASQGVFQIVAPSSGAMSDYGEYDKSTIMKEVKSVVTLVFKVE